jgi:hypothetical protein
MRVNSAGTRDDALVKVQKSEGIAAAAKRIGRKGRLTTAEGFVIWVRVTDVRMAYGRIEYHVVPHYTGEGEAWVRTDRVTF